MKRIKSSGAEGSRKYRRGSGAYSLDEPPEGFAGAAAGFSVLDGLDSPDEPFAAAGDESPEEEELDVLPVELEDEPPEP